MVNHIRTLLLNERAGTDSVYIDPAFMPVTVPPELVSVRNTLYPVGASVAKRVLVTDTIVRLCHTPELEPYMLWFDGRLTYSFDSDATLVDMCGVAPAPLAQELLQRFAAAPLSAAAHSRLYTWPRYEEALKTLRTAAASPTESVLRLGAIAIAYAFQLERVRIGE